MRSWDSLQLSNIEIVMPETYDKPCNYGYCMNQIDVKTGKIVSGFGPVACPCDHTRGWRREYPEQQGKPHPPIKKKSGRVMRRRRELKEWQQLVKQMEYDFREFNE